MRVRLADLFATLPPEWPDDPLAAIRAHAFDQKVVVVDDDPTGTQTVHGIPVLADWSVPTLSVELATNVPAFYLLTNSRSLSLAEAQEINATIGAHLVEAAQQVGRRFVVASRSDSTLRGHFPGEVDALMEALGGFDGILLIPAFMAGRRFTAEDVHYVAEGEWLVPAGETEFARDAVFGYRASNLRDWVQEKMQGRIPASDVAAISLDDIRLGGPERVSERLQSVRKGSVCVVNAVTDRDLAVVALGVVQAEAQGCRFIYRTAASFVAARAGMVPRPLLATSELGLPASGGGLIVVGSYVPKTSSQVTYLLDSTRVATVEVDVEKLLSDTTQPLEIERATDNANRSLDRDEDVVVFTTRNLIIGSDSESSLAIGRRVSQSLTAIVRTLSARPRYVLAKGGITSSDIATQGLDVQRAMVLGQILPGVPVWQLGSESRYPGLVYIVFPGNVGDERALADVVDRLRQEG